jgi:alkanesulfonate monooxygenase SsuD/methylene tetrahydromethanopterin reductase-like flavin-dependent oxidoreductase (luciferase family)
VVSADGPALGAVTATVRIGFRTSPQKTDWVSLEAAWAEAGRYDVFDSGWMNDHLTDPGLERGGPSFVGTTALAALAHHVPGKTVGHTVLAATFRHPSVLAKEALTLDHLTGGRFILGLGAGWHVGEHDAFGIELPPIAERMGRYEASIQVIKALFSEAALTAPGVTLDAPPFRLSGATMEPAPRRPGGPPLWVGGQGPRGLRIAARYADGWNFASNLDDSPSGFVDRRDALLRACDAIGRDPAGLTISAQIVIPGDPVGRRAATERAIGFGRDGAHEILLTTPAREGAAGIRRLATDVAARLRDTFG